MEISTVVSPLVLIALQKFKKKAQSLKYIEDQKCEQNKRTVALFIPTLGMGGAERQVLELAKGIDKNRWNVLILTNSVHPSHEAEVACRLGIRIVFLNKKHKLLYPFKLLSILIREKPSILVAYLISAQAYALSIRFFVPKIKFIFSVRDALDYSLYHGRIGSFFGLLLDRGAALVDCYIFNSVAGRNIKGYLPISKTKVIPNGIDTHRYAPDNASRTYLMHELAITLNGPFVGIIGNVSVYKGYDTLIHSARKVLDLIPEVHFVAIGNHDSTLGQEMERLVGELKLSSVFHFLGSRSDVHKLAPAFDVLCSSSVTEGFANAICEGMACGVPCVVTNVGDSAAIVGETGVVVPVSDPDALAAGIVKLLLLSEEDRRRLGGAARMRIVELFSTSRMVEATEQIFEQLLDKHSFVNR